MICWNSIARTLAHKSAFLLLVGFFCEISLNMSDISLPLIEKHDNRDVKTERGLQSEVKTVF